MKTGWAGLGSYTTYKVETQVRSRHLTHIIKANLQGYNQRKVYAAYRRYNDFVWLHGQLQGDAVLQGYALPLLPEKRLLGSGNEGFVEKRRQELQIYLEMLVKHPQFRVAKTLRAFLTCEKTEEFEAYKARPHENLGNNSLVLASLKSLRVKDTVKIIYSLIKSKFVIKDEPADVQSMISFDDIVMKIDKYLPLLKMSAKLVDGQIEFARQQARMQTDMAGLLGKEEGPEVQHVAKYYHRHNALLNVSAILA